MTCDVHRGIASRGNTDSDIVSLSAQRQTSGQAANSSPDNQDAQRCSHFFVLVTRVRGNGNGM